MIGIALNLYIALCKKAILFFKNILFIYLFLERGQEREGEREGKKKQELQVKMVA